MKTTALPLAVLLFSFALLRADDLYIDDVAINNQFSEKLGAIAERKESISAKSAGAKLREKVNANVAQPQGGNACAPAGGKTLYVACKPAVVAVGSVYKCGKCEHWHLGSFATGWLASADGLVVTNYHVLDKEDDRTIGVMTADGEVYAVTDVLAGDKAGDAAILRIDGKGKPLPYLALADKVTPGDAIEIISHPKGRFYTLSTGVVARMHRTGGKGRVKADWITVTADYAVGSSGGPVMNERGEVVGMVSSTSTALTGEQRGKQAGGEAVQMVFKDCVALSTIRALLAAP